jgi:hypothetical protein
MNNWLNNNNGENQSTWDNRTPVFLPPQILHGMGREASAGIG